MINGSKYQCRVGKCFSDIKFPKTKLDVSVKPNLFKLRKLRSRRAFLDSANSQQPEDDKNKQIGKRTKDSLPVKFAM